MRTTALTLAVCLAAATVPAAEPPTVSIGSRVRAWSGEAVVHGTLIAFGPEGLTIETRQGRDATTLGLERIDRLQVSHGRRVFAGVFWGAVIAALAGFVAGLVEANHAASRGECEMCGLGAVVYPVLAIPVGALVGAAAAPPAWHDVSLPALQDTRRQGVRFRVAPVEGGARFALSYGF
jgi:hypothetical protein